MKTEMNKGYKNQIIISTMATLVPIVAGLLLWNKLPDQIATHFDSSGIADGWSGRLFTVIGLPFIMTVVHLILVVALVNDPKKNNISRKMMSVCMWIVPVISCVVMSGVLGGALGMKIDISKIIDMLLGLMFIILGNYMTKTHQNYTVGIKLPWTLNSRENWNRTHRLAGKLFILTGFVFLIDMFINTSLLVIAVALVAAFVPMIYSFVLYKKGI